MTFCAVEIRHKEVRKLLVNTLCCGDETQRSVEASCEHTSSHQVAHRNDLHNGMKTFLFVQSAEALYQQRLLTPESYVARKSLACKTLAPSAVAFATFTLRAYAYPDTKCLFECMGCGKHFPTQQERVLLARLSRRARLLLQHILCVRVRSLTRSVFFIA